MSDIQLRDNTPCDCVYFMKRTLNTKCRRFALPLTAAFPLVFIPQFKIIFTYIYFPIISGITGFIIFWNFPFLVYMTASRPLYYEDIFIDEGKLPNYNVNPRIRERFQCILLWVLIITNSLLVAALSDYWLYKTIGHKEFLEIIGITGGIIKIFQIVNNTIGRMMLKIIKKEIVGESMKYVEKERESIEKIVNLKHINHKLAQSIELTTRNKNIIISTK